MDAAKRIKQLMEERGWSEYKLAKEAHLSHSTVVNFGPGATLARKNSHSQTGF